MNYPSAQSVFFVASLSAGGALLAPVLDKVAERARIMAGVLLVIAFAAYAASPRREVTSGLTSILPVLGLAALALWTAGSRMGKPRIGAVAVWSYVLICPIFIERASKFMWITAIVSGIVLAAGEVAFAAMLVLYFRSRKPKTESAADLPPKE